MFQGAGGKALPYQLLEPERLEPGRKYPLVIFFHGDGKRGDDNQKQLKHGIEILTGTENRKQYPCFYVAPQCPAGEQWVNVPWSEDAHAQPNPPSSSMALAMALIEHLQELYGNIDARRLYITGLSMGGFGTWDAITRWPHRFAAAVPICGGGDTAQASKLVTLPIWAFHARRSTRL